MEGRGRGVNNPRDLLYNLGNQIETPHITFLFLNIIQIQET